MDIVHAIESGFIKPHAWPFLSAVLSVASAFCIGELNLWHTWIQELALANNLSWQQLTCYETMQLPKCGMRWLIRFERDCHYRPKHNFSAPFPGPDPVKCINLRHGGFMGRAEAGKPLPVGCMTRESWTRWKKPLAGDERNPTFFLQMLFIFCLSAACYTHAYHCNAHIPHDN